MKRLSHFGLPIVLTVIFSAIALFVSARIDYSNLFHEWKNLPLEELDNKASTYIINQQPDSAMACWLMMINAYHPDLSTEEQNLCAAAMNNVGYVYFFEYGDYGQSYSYLLRSKDISDKTSDNRNLTNVYLNIGNIYSTFNLNETAMEYYKKAFATARKGGDYESYVTIMDNLLNLTFLEDNVKSIKDEISIFSKDTLPEVAQLKSCLHSLQGVRFADAGVTDSAIFHFNKAIDCIDTRFSPERYKMGYMEMEALTLIRGGKTKMAIERLDTLHSLARKHGWTEMEGRVDSYLSDCFKTVGMTESSLIHKLRSLEISDSLLNSKRTGMIKDIQASHDMKLADEEIFRHVERHKLMTTYLVIGAIIIVVILSLLAMLVVKTRQLRRSNEELYRKVQESIRQPKIKNDYNNDCNSDQNDTTAISGETTALYGEICRILETDSQIYTPGFSIDTLADLLSAKNRDVSKAINECSGKNFNRMLNEYRIKEACQRLSDRERYGHLTIESVAIGLGYKSRSNFSSIFKEVTGLTPGEYVKIGKKESQNKSQSF